MPTALGQDEATGNLRVFISPVPGDAQVSATITDPRDPAAPPLTVSREAELIIEDVPEGSYEFVRGDTTNCLMQAEDPGLAVVFVATGSSDAGGGTFTFTDPRDPSGAGTGSVTDGVQLEFPGLPVGQHSTTLVEAPPGFEVTTWTCMDPWAPGHNESLDERTMLFDIEADEEVVCLCRAGEPGTVSIVLLREPDGAEASFARITFDWRVISPVRIEGSLSTRSKAPGVTCTIGRDLVLTYEGEE